MFNYYVLLIVILIFFTNCGADSTSCQKVSLDYLDAAADFIAKAKSHFPSQVSCENNKSEKALDCSDLLEMGYKKSGVYTIWPKNRIIDDKPLEVFCDMETEEGGWTLLQRRGLFGGAVEDFNKDWKGYKEGFGDIQEEFWLGNDNIFALTNQKHYSARFDMRTTNETMYAHYDSFWIDDEYNKYTLHITNHRGDAGNAMVFHKNKKFSTKDEDNDDRSDDKCAEFMQGGWWFHGCYHVFLNGRHDLGTIIWDSGKKKVLQTSEIKIRPRNFKTHHASLNNTPML